MVPWSSWQLCAAFAALAQLGSASEVSRAGNDSLLWGPYRSNLYFGIRPRIPRSLMTGFMWSKVEDYKQPQTTFRHSCEQNEFTDGYGWEEYDARTGGRQVFHDVENGLDVTMEFVRLPGGDHGGSWAARFKGTPREDPEVRSAVVFYSYVEGGQGPLTLENEYDPKGYKDSITLSGSSAQLGSFELKVTGPEYNTHPESTHSSVEARPLDRIMVSAFDAAEPTLWQTKPLVFEEMMKSLEEVIEVHGKEDPPPPWHIFTIRNMEQKTGNLHMVEQVFEGAFEFDVLFSSKSSPQPPTSKLLTEEISKTTKAFADRYKSIFKASKPFDKSAFEPFSKQMFSNLLGGVGYFYGDQIIDRSYDDAYDEDSEGFWEAAEEARKTNQPTLEGPYTLFTAVPSRSFFPRGFLWDEGFHLLPIADWDIGLTLEILKSWFGTMDENGWIPREQILGAEARSKVPQEFAIQYPHYANPPTLYTVIELLLDKVARADASTTPEERKAIIATFKDMYPRLKLNYEWYRKTQRGDLTTYDRNAFSSREGYRWRGRTPKHILTSGLDDYPRPQPPHPGELHVDLISWIGLMTRNMKRIATELDETSDAKAFAKVEEAIKRNIDDLHWDDTAKTFCDASIDDFEEHKLVCHKGYISVFPFLTGMLDTDSPRMPAILDLLSDPNELWSPHGIRSLSKKDEFYGTDENYWRSPVWMPINYLIVDNLLRVAQDTQSPHAARAARIYSDLRQNLVKTVYNSWKETGIAWEQYNPETGKGQRNQHFTGWTSLVVKLMCMPDLSSGAPRDEL